MTLLIQTALKIMPLTLMSHIFYVFATDRHNYKNDVYKLRGFETLRISEK